MTRLKVLKASLLLPMAQVQFSMCLLMMWMHSLKVSCIHLSGLMVTLLVPVLLIVHEVLKRQQWISKHVTLDLYPPRFFLPLCRPRKCSLGEHRGPGKIASPARPRPVERWQLRSRKVRRRRRWQVLWR